MLPYAHLNLRRNPFGDFSEADRTALAIVDINDVVERLGSSTAIQFVGEKGYGKTTHLLAIRSMFENAGYVHIPEGEKAAIPSGNPVLIDEAQRLTFWQRLRLFRMKVPLVLGTHRDFEPELKRAGRTVQTIAVEKHTCIDRLQKVFASRIEWVRRDSGPVPSVSEQTVESLVSEFGPDIRGMLGHLYDRIESLQSIECI